MKKLFAMFIAIVMSFCLCSCTSPSKEEKTAKAFVSAMADKDYEKAGQYSSLNPAVLEELFKDNDFSGLKYKSQPVDVDEFAGFTFENKDGVVFNCLVYKKNGKVGIGTCFTD